MEKRTSIFANGLIWFGAAVSIAEILTGTCLAPLGLKNGILAILLGHLIGCLLLFGAGIIGGSMRKSSMETVKSSFGQKGSILFSSLNVLQLVGWTGIMIVSGASAANAVISCGEWVWALVIGILIIVWIFIGIRNLGKINVIAMGALFILTIVLSTIIFKNGAQNTIDDSLSFGAAVELSVAMPLSWLPLISDYTREAEKPVASSFASAAVYFIVSTWMYVIGLGAAVCTGESDIAQIMMKAGLGIIALLIIIFSTVTTTFLDAFSAGVSSVSISKKISEKPAAIAVAVIGIVLAIFTPISNIEGFLYLIGSVFAPMIAIQLMDFFVLDKDHERSEFDWPNLIIWLIGFVIYRLSLSWDTPVGNTLPVMIIVAVICFIVGKIRKN